MYIIYATIVLYTTNKVITPKQAQKILRSCIKFVWKLCRDEKIAPDHGYEHAIAVAKLARIGLSDFEELDCLDILLVMLAALMHDVDDSKIFNTQNYANARSFLETTILNRYEKEFVIKMISLVSYSQNKNRVPPEFPKWAFIPRDADRIAGGGLAGVERAIAFNSTRPLFVAADLQMFSKFPISRQDIQSKFENNLTRQRSLFEFYITNWHDRGICASGSKKLQALFTSEYDALLDYWVAEINLLAQYAS